jgi:tungstate transport system substrate-binding protein
MRKFLIITAISMTVIAVTAVILGLFVFQDNQVEDLLVADPIYEEDTITIPEGYLTLATTSHIAQTGILDALAHEFYADVGIPLEYVYVEAGEALAIGRNGGADIVLDHLPVSEELFIREGYGVERIPVMYNDFVVVGPGDLIEETEEVGLLFTLIEVLELPFISRGDNSGAHQMELSIWESLQLDPTVNPSYKLSGLGMSDTLAMAVNENAFTLIDRGTWIRLSPTSNMGEELIIICQGDPLLLNQYGIIAVNPQAHPQVNLEGANAFIQWLTSGRGQELIAEFGVLEFGEPLFTPSTGGVN